MTQRNNFQTPDLPQRANALAAAASGQGACVTGAQAASARLVAPAGRTPRAIRIAVSLPIEVRDQFGGREETRTQFVMLRGAVLATASKVRVGNKLTVQNLKSGRIAECYVIAVEPVVREVHQVEVEFTRPQIDFWPVQFPDEDARAGESVTEIAKAQDLQIANPATASSTFAKSQSAPNAEVQQGSSARSLDLESSEPANTHDDQIVSLADSLENNFSSLSKFQSQQRFTPRVSPVDSVAQFRAANRAAHQREQRMKALYSILSLAALAGALWSGRNWLRQHPDSLRMSSAPVVQSSILRSTSPSVSAPSASPATTLPAPVQTTETPNTNPSAPDSVPAIETAPSAQVESKPEDTQIAVTHKAGRTSSHNATEVPDEAPLALPLRADNVGTEGRPELLSAVVSHVPIENAVLAPQMPKKIVPARLTHSVPAQYPPMARQIRVEGDVMLILEVDALGNVTSVKATSGAPLLRQAALEAVRRWKYQPATLGDKAVPSTETVKVGFHLK